MEEEDDCCHRGGTFDACRKEKQYETTAFSRRPARYVVAFEYTIWEDEAAPLAIQPETEEELRRWRRRLLGGKKSAWREGNICAKPLEYPIIPGRTKYFFVYLLTYLSNLSPLSSFYVSN